MILSTVAFIHSVHQNQALHMCAHASLIYSVPEKKTDVHDKKPLHGATLTVWAALTFSQTTNFRLFQIQTGCR